MNFKKHISFFFFGIALLFLNSCKQPYTTPNAEALNGYWEIENVTLADGSIKEFSINMNIDFIEVNDMEGVRTKVAPQLDGSYLNSGNAEQFNIRVENDSLNLYYKTPYATWKETVLMAQDSILEVINQEGKRYRYKRYSPLVIGE